MALVRPVHKVRRFLVVVSLLVGQPILAVGGMVTTGEITNNGNRAHCVRAVLAVKGGFAASNNDTPLTAPGCPRKQPFPDKRKRPS